MPFDPHRIRPLFPALSRTIRGHSVAYFDGPAGSQVPQTVADAVTSYLLECNANRGGPIATSCETDAIIAAAHRAGADLVGTDDPGEIVLGPNMTSLTFTMSRALARTWAPGDEILVSRLDHDANVTPWVLAARAAGATVRCIDVDLDDCTLVWESVETQLNERTKLVALGYASNAVGTINPVRRLCEAASRFGALTYIDAVHYAPHRLIDVSAIGCDFLVCSAYKFFGPHVGLLWGRRDLLESLQPDKLRPSPDDVPDRWMIGTQNHEGIAGVTAAIDYLASLGEGTSAPVSGRRDRLTTGFSAIRPYEESLLRRLLEGLAQIPGIKIWGITDPDRFAERVPTVSFTHDLLTPPEMAVALAEEGIFAWAGNHYALPFTEAAGLEPHGTLRIGLLHYNTEEEVQRLLESLTRLVTPTS